MNEKTYKIAIGIPSLNEAKNISYVTTQIDLGLSKYFPHLISVIVNVDNNSTDNTREEFLTTNTSSDKIYISTENKMIGKGLNISNFFQFSRQKQVKAAAIFDADIQSLTPEWVKKILTPVLLFEYDFVSPYYLRHKYDGTITNQICYPLLAGIFGVSVRQPIGGDFGFSKKFIDDLSASPLPAYACGFGIDIFITTQAIINNHNICSVGLGQKIHNDRSYENLIPMLNQVVDSLFQQILNFMGNNFESLKNPSTELKFPKLFDHDISQFSDESEFYPDTTYIDEYLNIEFEKNLYLYREIFPKKVFSEITPKINNSQELRIDSSLWCEIIFAFLKNYISQPKLRSQIINGITPLFFYRIKTYINDTKNLTMPEVESYLSNQTDLFFNSTFGRSTKE